MDGTSEDRTNFYHQGDVFILKRKGSLWKIVSSGTDPVDFERISKLWIHKGNLIGCVLYTGKLFVFRQSDTHDIQEPIGLNTYNCPGIFDRMQVMTIINESPCLPMPVPEACLSKQ
jgi:hypothetical protein